MAKDFPALKAELETNPRYDAAVVSGSNSAVVALLNEEDVVAAFVWDDVPVADVLEAAGQAVLEGLTVDQRARLQVLKQPASDSVAISRPGIRAELLAVFSITENQLAAGVPAARRRPTFGEAFGFKRASLNDVRQVVRLIEKSFIVSTGQV